jgi:uncharacterized protein YggU (UPF0235/DUF167 family)
MVIQIKVKANSRTAKLEKQEDGTWIAHVNAVTVDGKANARLIEMVAEYFEVRKSAVTIKTGATSRIKLILIES